MKNKFRHSFPNLARFLFSIAAIAISIPARAVTLQADDKGIPVQNGSMAELVIGYPELGPGPSHGIVNKEPGPGGATVTYNGGGTCKVSFTPDGEITYSFSGVPADVKSWTTLAIIDFSYQQGGTWKMDNGPANTFPVDMGTKPQFFQNHASTFQLTDDQGKSLTFHMPAYTYAEMTDNRHWNWAVYSWKMSVPFGGGNNRIQARHRWRR